MSRFGLRNGTRKIADIELQEKRKPFERPFGKSRFDGTSKMMPPPSPPSPPTTPPSPQSPCETNQLIRQNQELRDRLQEEASVYRRRLDTYKQAQQNQAALVGRLQSKVLQYKQKCSDLEGKYHAPHHGHHRASAHATQPNYTSLPYTPTCEQQKFSAANQDDILNKFENDKLRCDHLLSENKFLRQQLDDSHRANACLTNDLQKLTGDWEHLRDEMSTKEDEWKEEERAFNDYYNHEQNRLLKMWRDVGSVKKTFRDLQSSLKNELNRMRDDITSVNRNVHHACGSVSDNIRQAFQNDEACQLQTERFNFELKNQLASLQSQLDNCKHDIGQREQRIQEMVVDLKGWESRCLEAENQAAQTNRLNDEIERLTIALHDIAHVVVTDADTGDGITTSHLHLTQALPVPPKSPKRGGIRTSQAFAEGTISAVQAVLHKYQLVIHDLQVKLKSTHDDLNATKKQFDASEGAREILTSKLTELTEKMDGTNLQLSDLFKERDSLQKTLDGVRNEKHLSDREKAELNLMVDGISGDYEKLQNSRSNIQRMADSLSEEKKMLEIDLQRVLKDKDITELNLRAEESRSSSLREDIVTLREELNKLYLARDLLEQQRIESDEMLAISEKQRADLEHRYEKLHLEHLDVQYQLEKSSSSNDDVSHEAKELKAHIFELETDTTKLRAQIADQTADIASLKKELITAEQTRLDLDSEKLSVCEKLKMLEISKEKVEMELAQTLRDRGDLSNQLTAITCKKEQINEELMRLQQRLEQSNETNCRLNRSLEELMKENEDKIVAIEANEKEIQRHMEHFAALRSEKETLEAVLFDTNTNLEASANRNEQLDREVHELLTKQESMKNKILQLTKDLETCNRRAQEMKTQMTNAAANQEAEFLQKVGYLKSLGEENLQKWNEEKEAIRCANEKHLQHSMQALETSKDADIFALRERYESLQLQLDSVCQQHEEVMVRAENDKQQALLMAHRDKQAVAEKLDAVQRELKTENENLDRLRRESAARADKDRTAIKTLKDELAKLKTRLDEHRLRAEEEIKKLEIHLSSMTIERDNCLKDIDDYKTQLRLAEDKGNALNLQFSDACRRLKESESVCDVTRKELTDARRALAESNIERDKYACSNKELRDHVKRVEGQRREQARSLEESMQKITSLEEARASLENDRTRITTLLKETQNNMTKLTQEHQAAQASIQKMQQNAGQKDVVENELQARLCNENEERERVQQELHQLKKQFTDLDENLQATRQELGRSRCKANQDEHRFHNREQELMGRLEEGRGREKCLEDQKHNLEVCLADATQQIQELKARLGGAENRVRALDEQLAAMEACKKEVEYKLTSILHTLKRIAGIQLDGSLCAPYRLMSPSRRFSPARSGHDFDRSCPGECSLVDVDPELVRKSVRTLMQQVAQVERDREDYKAQLNAAKKQLEDAASQHTKSENKISKLQQVLRTEKEEKANLEAKIVQKQMTLNGVEEAMKLKSDDFNMLKEKYKSLESQLHSVSAQRAQSEDRLEKCRQNEARLESEKRHMQDELNRSEGRASKLDLQRIALDGDIQRLQMALQEKDNQIRNYQERIDNQTRSSAQIEDRCVALKTSVDQLKERLQNSAITETELRGELNCIQKERTEQSHSLIAAQDKLKHMQKSMSTSENERHIISERLDAAQNALNDLHRSQQSQQDVIQRLQDQSAELEVQKSTLEAQLRIAKWNGGGSADDCGHVSDDISAQLMKTQREKNELRLKVETLNEKLRHIENDKLSKFSECKTYEKKGYGDGEYDSNRSHDKDSLNYSLDYSIIKQENHDLKIKIRRMETMLAEKESELARLKAKLLDSSVKCSVDDSDRMRTAHLQSERLLDARESHHKQQVTQLENQISMLREQLAQEAKRRQMYILRSSRAGREMHQLRQTLGDSLRNIAHEPVDPELLESETRRLDNAVSLSLPPTTTSLYDHGRGISPRSTYR